MAVKFKLTCYDVKTDELVRDWKLPGYREEDVRLAFELHPAELGFGCHPVRATQREDLETIIHEDIDLNEYDYFVEDYEDDPLTVARKIIRDLVVAADYLRQGGALDAISHAPDNGKKWHDALLAADEFLEEEEEGE